MVLKLNGEWTIERARELKGMLMDALNGDDPAVMVSLEEVSATDLSCLQLLCASHKSLLSKNKRLLLEGEPSEPVMRVAKDAGFVRTLSCHKNLSERCLWVGGLK